MIMRNYHRQSHDETLLWPAFVDGLAGLLVAVLFLLIFFVSSQAIISVQLENNDASVAGLREELVDLEQLRRSDDETITELNHRLELISEQLEASEQKRDEQAAVVLNLGRRLNAALAEKSTELSRYRSDFFGRVRKVLAGREDIRIVGDRFVIQSEVLFATASAEIGGDGKQQLKILADTIKEIAREIPSDIDWVIRVDGHTDARPIRRPEFPSNWELSTARALAVVRYLISQGVPADRLAPIGFAGYHPIKSGYSAADLRRNRRIEFKFTQR